jgi:16S rRNA U516 pseudouridylate synthase RsuA-like enzyme
MPKEAMTLDRVLSRFGLVSRTEARAAVLAGRLNKDTSGLLLTNDTDFADFAMNPESRIPMTYLVKTSGALTPQGAEVGKWRELKPAEVAALRKRAG